MLDGGADTDTLVGGAELQVLSKSGSVENVLYGGAGNDPLTAVARITVQEVQDPQPVTVTALNTLRGGAGQGFLRATADASGANANALNYLYGDNGNDTLSANARATSDYSDKASNYLSGAGGDDTLHAKAEGLGGGPPTHGHQHTGRWRWQRQAGGRSARGLLSGRRNRHERSPGQ